MNASRAQNRQAQAAETMTDGKTDRHDFLSKMLVTILTPAHTEAAH